MAQAERVFQIFLSTDDGSLPPVLETAIKTVQAAFPQCVHQLWRDAQVRQFIDERFGAVVRKAYDTLVPFAYKCDLARYCLLHAHGGWYVDVGVKMRATISAAENVYMIYFRDLGEVGASPFRGTCNCVTGLMYSRPQSPILQDAIDQVVANCERAFYGVSPLCPTGPVVFGRAIAKYDPDARHVVGDFMPLTPLFPQRNLCFVLPSGSIVAEHKTMWMPATKPGRFTEFAGSGTNDYALLWQARAVYRGQE